MLAPEEVRIPEDGHFTEVARLVRASRTGDEEAFRQLLEGHRDAVISTLFACGVRCPETARDLAQDVALRAWTRLGSLSDPRAFPAWIRRVAANAARDHLRRRAVRREDGLDEALELAADVDLEQRSEELTETSLMLAMLADEDDEVVELLWARAEGVPVDELATARGISQGALKMRLMRVRKRLRERLDALRRGGRVG
jgi:RNA polymerase sigma-70 factor (ECF subfamily)